MVVTSFVIPAASNTKAGKAGIHVLLLPQVWRFQDQNGSQLALE